MNKLLLCVLFLSIIVTPISSQSSVPLRGTVKNNQDGSLLKDDGEATTVDDPKKTYTSVLENSEQIQNKEAKELKDQDNQNLEIQAQNKKDHTVDIEKNPDLKEITGSPDKSLLSDSKSTIQPKNQSKLVDQDQSQQNSASEAPNHDSEQKDDDLDSGQIPPSQSSPSQDENQDEGDETISEEVVTTQGSSDKPNEDANEQVPECNSFVMWFASGIPVTTISCQKYSKIYTAPKTGKLTPKYVTGEVKTVDIQEPDVIKVNGMDLKNISTDSNHPSENSGEPKTKRLLDESTVTLQNVEVYSFPIGEREITVKLPNSDQAEERNKYTLSSNGLTFYSGSENNSKYSVKENGDLVNSNGEVVLKGDFSSSAIKSMYIISSLITVLISVLTI